jgi:hypothetical protein
LGSRYTAGVYHKSYFDPRGLILRLLGLRALFRCLLGSLARKKPKSPSRERQRPADRPFSGPRFFVLSLNLTLWHKISRGSRWFYRLFSVSLPRVYAMPLLPSSGQPSGKIIKEDFFIPVKPGMSIIWLKEKHVFSSPGPDGSGSLFSVGHE